MISCRWTENRKGAGNNSGESGARYLEAASIKSRTESTGVCVKFKTVTEVRQSSACDIFTTAGIYLVLNSLLDWEPVEKLKRRCGVVSFTFFQYDYEASHSHSRTQARGAFLINVFLNLACNRLHGNR